MRPYDPSTYVLCPALQQSFLNKDTGDLLAGGWIYFYQDSSRNTLQNIYALTGSPPSYTVTPLPNPLVLSSIGTIVDDTNEAVIVLLYPYDSNKNVSNYYVSVWSGDPDVDGVFQFDLQNIPGIGAGSGPIAVAGSNNYVVNGQFLAHNNIADNLANNGPGYIDNEQTPIAPGGHFFVTDATFNPSNFQKFVNFVQILDTSSPSGLQAFPRYWAQFVQTGTTFSGSYSQYTFRFPNVNMFAGATITFGFTAKTESVPTMVIPFYRQYFGSGGSMTLVFSQAAQPVTTTPTPFSLSFTVADTPSSTLGPNGDDYIEFGIGFPAGSTYNVYITDVFIFDGNVQNAGYPITSPQQMYYGALAGGYAFNAQDQSNPLLPQDVYDGYDLYLPVINKPSGFGADYSAIGQPGSFAYLPTWDNIPYLFADGSSYQVYSQNTSSPYLTSSLGIPYIRLANYLWNSTINSYIYGTGYQFFSATIPNSDNYLMLANNTFGSTSPATSSDAGFTVTPVAPSSATGYYVRSYLEGTPLTSTDLFYVENINPGIVNDSPNAQTSGFTISVINSAFSSQATTVPDSARQLFSVTTVAASALAVPSGTAKYFSFDSFSTVSYQIFVWYQITNETIPAGTGTGIKVNLLATDSASVVAQKTIAALIGGTTSLIQFTASSIVGGDYWSAESVSGLYNFWYTVDGMGTAPSISGTNVQIPILSSDSNNIVTSKTQVVINKFMVGVPDWRGMFLRGFNDNGGIDPDASNRYSLIPYYGGDQVGTFQYDQIMKHAHPLGSGGGAQQGYTSGSGIDYSGIFPVGGNESRPYNASVAIGIRY